MRTGKILLLTAAFAALLTAAPGIFAAPSQTVNLPDPSAGNVIQDDDTPDVTARVARISFISGDAQIRRGDSDTWERVTLNLPIVEGDEITTAANSRLEIQFDSYTHLRLAENAILRVVTLKDEGVALSLPQGTLSVNLGNFNKDKAYFEMDAPGSTIAVQRSGMYRIDAGDANSSEIRVGVRDGGEARIYSDTSGFTLKSGRSARVYLSGTNAGEWDTADVAGYADEFDTWALDREAAVAKLLQNAYYDKYYDRDIYGAEDLNGYGEWIYTAKYGYVWRPYSTAISGYDSWSPYRYGHWRWVPPFGWTWINDEPWGWATYHHGRWFYDNGYWYWSPYGYVRYARSWWSPALVFVTIYGGNVCWYPLPWDYGYYDYNWYYGHGGGWGGHHNGGHGGPPPPPPGGGGATPTPTPTGPPVAGGPLSHPKGPKTPPLGTVPPTGVVTVPQEDFGRLTKGPKTPPLDVARGVLSRIPGEQQTAPALPVYKDLKGRLSRDIATERPKALPADTTIKTGVITRKGNAPLDEELRTTRVLGGRPPLPPNRDQTPVIIVPPGGAKPRDTGAVERKPPVIKQEPGADTNRKPVDIQPRDIPAKPIPKYVPPKVEPTPAPTQRVEPRYIPPPKQEPPRQDPPKPPPPTSKEPPAKPTPKPPDKPAPTEKKKDG